MRIFIGIKKDSAGVVTEELDHTCPGELLSCTSIWFQSENVRTRTCINVESTLTRLAHVTVGHHCGIGRHFIHKRLHQAG